MEKFHELCIKITPQHTRDFLLAVDSALTKGWERATEAEVRAKDMGHLKLHDEMAYYCCDTPPDLSARRRSGFRVA